MRRCSRGTSSLRNVYERITSSQEKTHGKVVRLPLNDEFRAFGVDRRICGDLPIRRICIIPSKGERIDYVQ